MSDPFFILGLSAESSEREVKQAYKRLALKYHPDKTGGDADVFSVLVKARNDALVLLSKRKCPECNGTGLIKTTSGFHVVTTKCPECKTE